MLKDFIRRVQKRIIPTTTTSTHKTATLMETQTPIYNTRQDPQMAITHETISRYIRQTRYTSVRLYSVRETDQNKIGVTLEILFPSPLTKDIT
jgi:hypothetical protein